MFRSLNPVVRPITLLLWVLSLVAVGFNASGQQEKPVRPRRPLPKPATGARGFDQTSGRDASSRLIAAAATRGALAPLAPAEGLAYDARPMFIWEAAGGARSYHFTLRDADDLGGKNIFETDVSVPRLIYPADAPSLKPGQLYLWQVSIAGLLERKVSPVVAFFVLASEDAMEVRQALQKARLLTAETPVDRLRQARIFAQFGVWYDALRMATELVARNPNDAEARAFYEHLMQRLAAEQQASTPVRKSLFASYRFEQFCFFVSAPALSLVD